MKFTKKKRKLGYMNNTSITYYCAGNTIEVVYAAEYDGIFSIYDERTKKIKRVNATNFNIEICDWVPLYIKNEFRDSYAIRTL